MSTTAWLQLAVFLALLLALAWPLARAIDAVMAGRFALGRRIEAPLWRLAGVQPERESGWLRYLLGLLVFNGLGVLAVYALQRLQQHLPLNPQGIRRGHARLGLQHRHQLREQHQLAGLWRRIHHELPHPDAGPHGAELPVGRHRHRGGDGAGARLRSPFGQNHRQRVGRSDPRHAVGAAAAVTGAGAVLRWPGRDSERFALHRGEDAGDRHLGNRDTQRGRRSGQGRSPQQRHTDPGHGAGGLAVGHQDGRHQRGWLLQRQLGAPVREPHGHHQLRADARHLPDPGCAVLRVRAHGGRPPPRLGGACRHDRAVRGLRGCCNQFRAPGQPGARHARR